MTLAKLGDVFGMTADELLASDEREFKIGDPQLVRTLHEAQELDEDDKRMTVRFCRGAVEGPARREGSGSRLRRANEW